MNGLAPYEVKLEMERLEEKLYAENVTSFNRFYFLWDRVVYNVTLPDGYLASAELVHDELLIRRSNRKWNEKVTSTTDDHLV